MLSDVFAQLFETVEAYAIFHMDSDGIICSWNKGACTIIALEEARAIGSKFSDLFGTEDREAGTPERLLQESARNGSVKEECALVKGDGTILWGEVLIVSLRDSSQNSAGFGIITRDCSDERKKRQRIEELQGEIDELVYSISHDLAAPMRAVQGFTNILVEDYGKELSLDALDCLGSIERGCEQLSGMIDAVLGCSRLIRGRMETAEVSLPDIVRTELERLFENAERDRVDLRVAPLPVINGDYNMVRRIVRELLSNALKFSNEKEMAIISISWRWVEPANGDGPNGQVETAGKENFYCLSIEDNGAGFDMNYVDRLFVPFQRLHSADKFDGLGMGLTLVRKLCQRHGWTVAINSKRGEGTVVTVTIPSADVLKPAEQSR